MKVDRFEYERRLLAGGHSIIAGVDEVGRGPLAGPVVAAAVVLPFKWIVEGVPDELRCLNDSKQLSESRREEFCERLMSEPELQWAVAEIDNDQIDRINILQATHRAMETAIASLPTLPEWILVDGLPVPTLGVHQTAVVKGDSLSYSIAAASVIAKVTRDRQMASWDRKYPGYGFAVHKGYGTAAHREALTKLGPCPIHRRSFAPLKQPDPTLFGPVH